MVGNLVDNACKWASSRVAIEVLLEQAAARPRDRAHRGRRRRPRFDACASASRSPAAGYGSTRPSRARDLGLSIVVELAGLYGGALNLGTAPIGGLRAELVLPAG